MGDATNNLKDEIVVLEETPDETLNFKWIGIDKWLVFFDEQYEKGNIEQAVSKYLGTAFFKELGQFIEDNISQQIGRDV